MKRLFATGSVTLLIGLIGFAFWIRQNRYEILADSDLEKFTTSGRNELYTYYPQLIDKIAEDHQLARRVVVVHLSVSNFDSPELGRRGFHALARLPNLKTVECTYSHNVDRLVPTLNQIATLEELHLYYCEPIDQVLSHLDNGSLRSIHVHGYGTIEFPKDITDAFAKRMPECAISFTAD